MAESVLRQLLVGLGFKVDRATVDAAEEAIASVKTAAEAVGQVGKEAGEKIAAAFGSVAAEAAEKLGEEARAALAKIPDDFRAIEEQAKILGKSFSAAEEKAALLEKRIREMAEQGLAASSPVMQSLGHMRKQFAEQAESEAEGGMLGRMGERFGVKEALGAVGGPIAGLFALSEATKGFAEFQETIQQATAAFGGGQEDAEALQQAAARWAMKLGRTPAAVAEAMQDVASKGFGRQATEQMAPIALKLAHATMSGVDTSAGAIAGLVHGFYGGDASKAGHVGDVLAVTRRSSGMTMEELSRTMGFAAPAFSAMHQSLGELATLTAVLGQSGISGRRAAGILPMLAARLAAPTAASRSRLQAAGLGDLAAHLGKNQSILAAVGLKPSDIQNAKGEMLPLVDILRSIVARTQHMGDAQRMGVFSQIFGQMQGTQVVALTRALGHGFGALKERIDAASQAVHGMEHNQTALDAMYETTEQGLLPAWRQFLGALQTVSNLLLAAVAPALEAVMGAFVRMAAGIANLVLWFQKTRWAMATLKIVLALLLPGIAMLGLEALGSAMAAGVFGEALAAGLIPALVGAATAAWSAAAAFLAAAWPVLLVGAAIGAAVLVVQDLWVAFSGGHSVLKDLYERFMAWTAKLGWLGTVIRVVAALVVGPLFGSIAAIVWAVHDLWNGIHGGKSVIFEVFGSLWHWIQVVGKWLAGLPNLAGAAFMGLAKAAVGWLAKIPGIGLFLPGFNPGGALAGVAPGAGGGGNTFNYHSSVVIHTGQTAHPAALAHLTGDHVRKTFASMAHTHHKPLR